MRSEGCAVLLALLALVGTTATASGYVESSMEDSATSTHQFIMDSIPAILDNDGHPEIAALLRGGWLSRLKAGTMSADANLFLSREHYMDPNTHSGLLGFTSAGDKAESEFAIAEQAWRAGRRDNAVLHLGWAMHMVQDLTVPHHARLTFLDSHADYEGWVLAHQSEIAMPVDGAYDLPDGGPGHHGNASRPWDWVDFTAHQSWPPFDYVDGPDGSGGNDYRLVASQMLPLAARTSAGFLYRMLERLDAGPPVADAGPDATVFVGQTAALDGIASTDDVAVRSFLWRYPDGTTIAGATVPFRPMAAGPHAIELTVTDAFGKTGTDAVTITAVTPKLVLPTYLEGVVRVPVTIEARLSDGSFPESVTWTAGPVRVVGPVFYRAFTAPGLVTIGVSVRDWRGVSEDRQVLLRVRDIEPPVARITAPAQAFVGEEVVFNGTASTDDTGIVAYAWTFGDGSAATGERVAHRFATAESHTIILEVRDADGNRRTASFVIEVVARPQAASGLPDALPFAVIALLLAIGLVLGWRFRRRRTTDLLPPPPQPPPV